jgi:hypothetical protein
MSPHVPITDAVFAAFLQCETKAHLLLDGTIATDPEIESWQRDIWDTYATSALETLRSRLLPNEAHSGMPSLQAVRRKEYRLILRPTITLPEIAAHPHALERRHTGQAEIEAMYSPIRFCPSEKLKPSDRLIVAFDALALSRLIGRTPSTARIIHGSDHRSTAVQLPRLIKEARSLVDKLREQSASGKRPSLALNNTVRNAGSDPAVGGSPSKRMT